MFAPNVRLVALFGDSRIEQDVIALDEDGIPLIVNRTYKLDEDRIPLITRERKLVRADKFADYRGIDVKDVAFIPACAGWRAAYLNECTEEDGSVTTDVNILPVAAWKQSWGSLTPLVPTSWFSGKIPEYAMGRHNVSEPETGPLLAIYGPGEEMPPKERLIADYKKTKAALQARALSRTVQSAD